MYFLIDYENVNSAGFQGKEFLCSDDTVIIFYSKCVPNIKREIWNELCNSGCTIDTCKLEKQSKNGLDFYIVSRVAEIVIGGCDEAIVIISEDKGFKAVKDYWESKSQYNVRILIRKDIEEGIFSSNEQSERRKVVLSNCRQISIDEQFEEYKQNIEREKKIKEIYKNTEYEKYGDAITKAIDISSNKREVYLVFLKRFGKEDGLEAYRLLKENYY